MQETTENKQYRSPSARVEGGKAPGMKVKLLSEGEGVRNYVVIFAKGDEVLSGITDFAEEYEISSASLTAVGALSSAVTGWFEVSKKMYKLNPVSEQVELISLIGDIALTDGKPAVHAHLSIGLSDGTVKGGHLIEAYVFPTVELFVRVFPAPLEKTPDEETDVKLIDLTK